MRQTRWLVGGMVIFMMGIAATAFSAGVPKPKPAGTLWVVDATGKNVGKARSEADATGRLTHVTFTVQKQAFLLAIQRQKAVTFHVDAYFTTPDCSGQSFLQDSGGIEAAHARMLLLAALAGEEGTVWVVDPHTTPLQTIQPQSYGLDGGGEVRSWRCSTDVTGSREVFPATRVFDFYHEVTPPFAIR